MTKQFSKEDLKKFVYDMVWTMIPENSKVDRVAMVNIINSRVDITFEPLEKWISEDGELDSILELIDNLVDEQ